MADANGDDEAAAQAASGEGDGDGQALPGQLLPELEEAAAAALGGVRVHDDESAHGFARAQDARAVTVGQEIYFGQGEFNPDAADGRHLIAHEVAHTVQQRGSEPVADFKREASLAESASELEADSFANAFMVGAQPASLTATPQVAARKSKKEELPPSIPIGLEEQRSLRVTAYFNKAGRRKNWIGNTTELSAGTYTWYWRNGDWDFGEFPDTAGLEVFRWNAAKGKETDHKPVTEWAKGAQVVVISVGASLEEMFAEQIEESLGDPDAADGQQSGSTSPAGQSGDAQDQAGEVATTGGDPQTGEADGSTQTSDQTSGQGQYAGGRSGGESTGVEEEGQDGIGPSRPIEGGQSDGTDVGEMDLDPVAHENETAARVSSPGSDQEGVVPSENGKKGGMVHGDDPKGEKGGVPGAPGWLGVISLPASVAMLVYMAGILSDAEIIGAADELAAKAGKYLAKKAKKKGVQKALKVFKKQIQSKVDGLVAKGMKGTKRQLKATPEWLELKKAERASKLAQMESALRNHVERRMSHHLSRVEAEATENADDVLEMADEIDAGGSGALEGFTASELRKTSDAMRKQATEAHEAIDRLGEVRKQRLKKQGDGSYKQFDDAHGGGVKPHGDVDGRFKSMRTHWTQEETFDGMKVYQRNDYIDPAKADAKGRTSLERMQKGRAPIGPDGRPVELHHLNQSNDGPVVEVSDSFHSANYSTLHINGNGYPSGIDRGAFEVWKEGYWKHRAKDFLEKPK